MALDQLPPRWRLPLLLMGMGCLVFGVLGGLSRLAVAVPAFGQQQAGSHGALMLAGFFGIVISLERAVALHRLWPYLAPLGAGLGGFALLFPGAAPLPAALLFCLAGAVFVAASFVVYRQLPRLFTLTLLLGAGAWLSGNLLWLLGGDIGGALYFWMGFLVLTIAGERLELTRFLPPQPLGPAFFVAILAVLGIAATLVLAGAAVAPRVLAGGLLLLAAWCLRYDIARRTVRQQGLTRFTAACLLAGYGWLAVAGLLGLAGAFEPGHAWRDAALHAVFLGFVFSMVIGHAPIIFPAVMRVRIPYHPYFYLPLAALQLSLLLRLAGNLGETWALRQAGGLLNGLSLALFVGATLISVRRAPAAREATP